MSRKIARVRPDAITCNSCGKRISFEDYLDKALAEPG